VSDANHLVTISDFVVEESVAIRPLFPMSNQAGTHEVLADIIPLFANGFGGSQEPIKLSRLPLATRGKIMG